MTQSCGRGAGSLATWILDSAVPMVPWPGSGAGGAPSLEMHEGTQCSAIHAGQGAEGQRL